jgi:hypothetical protein
MAVQGHNPSTQKAEAGGSQVLGQPGLHSKTYLKTKTEKEEIKETW